MDLPLPLTMLSTQKKGCPFRSEEQHRRWTGFYAPEPVGHRFGRYTVTDSKFQRIKGYKKLHVKCDCGREDLVDYASLVKGTSQGCRSCGHRYSKHQKILGRRYDAIVSRCTNPKDPHWHRYGGRGIENRFNSRHEFVQWVESNLPHPSYSKVEIDRIDNQGHYEPGNLQLATRREQMENRAITKWIEYRGEHMTSWKFAKELSPFHPSATNRYARQGLTGEQIIARALDIVNRRYKKWKQLAQRCKELGYMT